MARPRKEKPLYGLIKEAENLWLSNDILETMKFEGLNNDPDLWKTCETK